MEDSDKILHAKKRKRRNSENTDLTQMNNNDLISEVKRLNKHIKQLKVLLDKANSKGNLDSKDCISQRYFDFSKYNKRHILLKFAYLGWNYQV